MPSNILICLLSLYSFPPQSWSSHLNSLGAAGKKWVSPVTSCTAGEAKPSLLSFSPAREFAIGCFSPVQCCHRRSDSTGKVPLSVSSASSLGFFIFPPCAGFSSLGKLNFSKSLLSFKSSLLHLLIVEVPLREYFKGNYGAIMTPVAHIWVYLWNQKLKMDQLIPYKVLHYMSLSSQGNKTIWQRSIKWF